MDYDVVVIGAGPAGLMAGGVAAKAGVKVVILEQGNTPGQKLSITGGGRCNITNAEYDTRKLLSHYGDAAKFLYTPFAQFDVQSTFSFFEKLGLPLVIEARKRAFPKSQSAQDVVDTMVKFAESNGAEIVTGVSAKRFYIAREDEPNSGKVIAVETSAGKYHAKEFILATGGLSGRASKSKGIGFKMLSEIGHKVHEASPDLVPLKSSAKWVRHLSGIAPSFMTVRFKQDGRVFLSKTGKLLFTHFGLSGPLIINSASEVKRKLANGPVVAAIDLFPDTDHKMLDTRLLKLFDKHKNKQVKNVFTEIIEDRLAIEILKLSGIKLEQSVNEITREQRKKLVHTLKELVVPIVDTMGMDRAIVADGGVDLTELDFKTMSSKLHNNVHIVGDLLNITRPSGGYSLQLCWTTGNVAGKSAYNALQSV
jgi:predicted Rossmann fold flavoprotein